MLIQFQWGAKRQQNDGHDEHFRDRPAPSTIEVAVGHEITARAFPRSTSINASRACEDRILGARVGAKFPETGWAPLEEIRAGKWARLEPRPVRIFAARFLQVNSWQVPCYFALQPGEFIQGLLAHISPRKRVYVVTVPAPAGHAGEWAEWPRVVQARQ